MLTEILNNIFWLGHDGFMIKADELVGSETGAKTFAKGLEGICEVKIIKRFSTIRKTGESSANFSAAAAKRSTEIQLPRSLMPSSSRCISPCFYRASQVL
jgi:hypothetical protein